MHVPVHGARNTTEQLLCKTTLIFMSYGPQQARAELN